MTTLYAYLFAPRSTSQDDQRREFIVNSLVCGLTILTTLVLVVSLIDRLTNGRTIGTRPFIVSVIFLVLLIGLWYVSRRGSYKAVGYLFITLLAVMAIRLMLIWSFELPAAELLAALIIVMAGVLLNTRLALYFTGTGAGFVLVLGYLQSTGHLTPRSDWLMDSRIDFSDAVSYAALLIVMGMVAWLSNREIERSLVRAWTSEAALHAERDSLEIKVAERTQKLEELQLARIMELQRFADFGRVSASLLHEVTNPLTAAALTLDQAAQENHSSLVRQTRQHLRQLERYVSAARQQLAGQSKVTTFPVRREITQVIRLLQPRARRAQITLRFERKDNFRLRGDPVKFSQIIGNLVVNALDATEITGRTGEVIIEARQEKNQAVIIVTDHGTGIPARQLPHIFEPFFSTKAANQRGLGIGLATVKQFVERDFGGRISVANVPEGGAAFTVKIPLHSKGKNHAS